MKLKNKLLPLTGIAALAAVATPLMTFTTSCSVDHFETYDLAKGYEYKGGLSPITSQSTISNATKMYMDAIKSNPELLIQDYLNSLWTKNKEYIVKEEVDEYGKFTKYVVGITKPVFGSTTISYPGEGSATYPTISFKIRVETVYERTNDYLARTYKEETVGEIAYKNVPFYAYSSLVWDYYGTTIESSTWNIGIRDAALQHPYIFQYMTDEWSIKGNTTTKDTITNESGTEETETSTQSIDISTYNQLSNSSSFIEYYGMDFTSTYLSEVKVAPELQTFNNAITETSFSPMGPQKRSTLTFPTFKLNVNFEDVRKAIEQKTYVVPATISGFVFSRPFLPSELSSVPKYTVDQNYSLLDCYGNYGSSLYGSSLIIEKGAKFTLDTTNNQSVTLESSGTTEGRVYIQLYKEYIEEMIARSYNPSLELYRTSYAYRFPLGINMVDADGNKLTVSTDYTTIGGQVTGTLNDADVVKSISVATKSHATFAGIEYTEPNIELQPVIFDTEYSNYSSLPHRYYNTSDNYVITDDANHEWVVARLEYNTGTYKYDLTLVPYKWSPISGLVCKFTKAPKLTFRDYSIRPENTQDYLYAHATPIKLDISDYQVTFTA